MKCFLLLIFSLVFLSLDVIAQTKVAGYRNDFSLYNSSSNWKYYWNKPDNWEAESNPGDLSTGEIGNVASYTPLISTGNMLTADGDENGGNSSPDTFVRLHNSGGHPGAQGTERGLDRYAICAYTVTTPGNYYILNSSINITNSKSSGVLIYIHVNSETPVLKKTVLASGEQAFDVAIGELAAGDVVYVCFGANGQSAYDGFTMDFDISIVDEPETNDYYVSDYGAAGNGSANDLEAIQKAVKDFASDPFPATLHFENIIYRCTGGGILFDLGGARNKTILGNGAELIVEPSILGLQINNCDNVVVKDMTFDSDPLSWTQGTIKNIDAANNKFTLEIDEGYPIPNNNYGDAGRAHPWGMIWEPEGYTIKNELVWIASSQNMTENTVELSLQDNNQNAIYDMKVNDRFTADVFGVGGSFNKVSESKNIKCENLTFYATRSLVFAILDNVGQIHMDGIEMRRRPGTNRLLSCYRDGFHCKRNAQGPIIENCYVEGLCDDAINLSGGYYYVTEKTSSTEFQLDNASGFAVGDTLLFVDMKNGVELGKSRVASRSGNNITTTDAIEGVVTGEPRDANTTFVSNLSKSNSGFIIRNNTFGGQRRYAMLVRCQNGLIENNTGENLGGGIILTNEIVSFFEGPFPRIITIQNNSFTNIRRWPLWLKSSSYARLPQALVQDIRLIDNTFGPSRLGVAAATFQHVDNVSLSGNKFFDETSAGGIAITNSRNINFECNNNYNHTNILSLEDGIVFGDNVSASDVAFSCDTVATSVRQSIHENSFRVYPNPVKDKLYINTELESFQLEIIDVYGKRIKTVKNAPETIDFSGLCTGVYWVIVTTANEKFQRKIIKY